MTPTARTPAPKKATKAAPAKKASAKKVVATKAPAKKVVATKAPAKKAVATKAPAKKVPVKKSVVTKAPAKKVAATKAPAKTTVAKAAPAQAKKSVAKAAPAPAKKAAAQKAAVVAPAPAPAPTPPPARKVLPPLPKKVISPFGNDTKFLAEQKQMLIEERATYQASATSLRAEADALALDRVPGDVQFDEEGGEGGTATVDRERDLALAGQALNAVEEIDLALERIMKKTYGGCERCGQPLPKARLKALPYARMCVACKAGGLSRR